MIIKGDKGVGKTSLFNRLQGKPFKAEHVPTTALQSAKVSWNYRASHNVVNLEVWDCVDVSDARNSQNKSSNNGSDLSSSGSSKPSNMFDELDLDSVPVAGRTPAGSSKTQLGDITSSVVDVLRGTHAVVLVFNPMKKSSWDYVKRELHDIPQKVQVLVMANFKDVLEDPNVITLSSDTVDVLEARTYLQMMSQGEREIYFLESSMLNCFGLKGLKTFLNLPFLILQREFLETQLAQNSQDLQTANDEYRLTTENDSYSDFLKLLNARKSASSNSGTSSAESSLNSSSASVNQSQEMSKGGSSPSSNASPSTTRNASGNESSSTQKTPSQKIPKKAQAPVVSDVVASPSPSDSGSGFFSKVFNKKKEPEVVATTDSAKAVEELRKLKDGKKPSTSTVDDFVPEEDNSWLADDDDADIVAKKVLQATKKVTLPPPKKIASDDSDDDDDDGRPQIAAYDDELDEMDAMIAAQQRALEAKKSATKAAAPVPAKKAVAASNDSDSEDEDGGNPMLAGYEEDLDFDDQKQLSGKPRPTPVAAAPATRSSPSTDSFSAKKSSANYQDSDSDSDGGNPQLAKFEDYDDFDAPSPIVAASKASPQVASKTHVSSSPKTTASPSLGAGQMSQGSNSSFNTPSPMASNPTAARSNASPLVSKASSRPVVAQDSDSDSDGSNHLVASDDSDSDEEYAGFVPKKVTAAAPVQESGLLDFNPLDADSDADANAFWASSRAPARKTTSAAPTTPQGFAAPPNNSLSLSHQQQQPAAGDAFGYTNFSADSPSSTSSSHSKKDKKDKHHKHKDKKDKHHKHKDKSHHHSQTPQMAPGPAHDDWNFTAQQPPVATQPPPQPAPKKSVFYL